MTKKSKTRPADFGVRRKRVSWKFGTPEKMYGASKWTMFRDDGIHIRERSIFQWQLSFACKWNCGDAQEEKFQPVCHLIRLTRTSIDQSCVRVPYKSSSSDHDAYRPIEHKYYFSESTRNASKPDRFNKSSLWNKETILLINKISCKNTQICSFFFVAARTNWWWKSVNIAISVSICGVDLMCNLPRGRRGIRKRPKMHNAGRISANSWFTTTWPAAGSTISVPAARTFSFPLIKCPGKPH